jgi:hypothetical protein
MQNDYISLQEAAQLTGLPVGFIGSLAESGEVLADSVAGEPFVKKSSLLGWCALFAKVLAVVVKRNPEARRGCSLTCRSLVWMAQAGFLKGRDRVRL